MRVPTGSSDRYLYFVAVDSVDLKTRETALGSFSAFYSLNGAAEVQYTTPTVTEIDATNMPGVYALLLDEGNTINASHDEAEMCIHITQASMAPVTRTYELFRPKITEGQTVTAANGAADADVERIQGTVVATPATAGILDVNVKNIDNDAASASGTVTFPNATLASTTNITAGTITTATNVTTVNGLAANVITATSIQADAITAAKVADGTIDAATFAAGAINAAAIATGAIDADALATDAVTEITDATKTALGIVSGTADSGTTSTVVDAARTETDSNAFVGWLIVFTSGTNIGQSSRITTFAPAADRLTFEPSVSVSITTEDYLLIPEAEWQISPAYNVDANVQQISGSDPDVWLLASLGMAAGNIDTQLDALPTAAENADAVWDEDATAHQTQGTFGQAIGDPVADTNTIYKAVVTDATGATVGVDVVAIKAETAIIATDTTTDIPATLATLATAASIAALPTAATNATALLDAADAIETGLTPRGALRLAASATAGKLSGAGTGTEVFRNAVADTKARLTATVDASGNRTAITTDVT